MTPAELEALANTIAKSVADRLNQQPRLLSREELARTMSVSIPTIDRMRREGQLPYIKIRGAIRYDPGAVIEHLTLATELNNKSA